MKLTKLFFWPDTHAPFFDRNAVSIALEIMAEIRPNIVVILGDFFDCHSVAKREFQDPLKAFDQLDDELIEGRDLLSKIEKRARSAKFVFCGGNHEARISTYTRRHCGKLARSIKTEREILRLPKHFAYLPYGIGGAWRYRNLVCTHGHRCGKHSACAMLSDFKCSVVFGHTHRYQVYTDRSFLGGTMTAVNVPWLGDLETAGDYCRSQPTWCHGVGWGYASQQFLHLQVSLIQKQGAVVNGRTIKI